MAYKKIPLEEQLEKAGRERIHPEYDACAVQAFGNMQLSDYMKNDNCRTRLAMMLSIPPERLEEMTVRETAALISRHKRPGPGTLPHRELLRLFAAPMSEAYRAWKEAQDKKMKEKKMLEERLAACGDGVNNAYPAVCWTGTLCYFYALSDMRGDFYYSTVYNCMASDEAYGNVSDSFVAEILSWAYRGELPELLCDEVICRILIEPFCDKSIIWKKGGKRT